MFISKEYKCTIARQSNTLDIVDQINNEMSKCFICAASFFSGVHSVGQSEKKKDY